MTKIPTIMMLILFILGNLSCTISPDAALKIEPPQALKRPHSLEKHGDLRKDPYFWMNQRDQETVLKHIAAENRYADRVLQGAENLSEVLFREMKGRIKENEVTPPYKMDGYFYYMRFEVGKEYPIYCRKHQSLDQPEQVILDVNELAKGKTYYSAVVVGPSPDHSKLTFAVDEVGRRFYTLFFKDLRTGQILDRKIEKTTGEWVWFNDNRSGLYTQQDPVTLRSDRVYQTSLDKNSALLIAQETDALFNLNIQRSLNGKSLFISSSSFDSSEFQVIDANRPEAKPRLFLKRRKNHLYGLEDQDSHYLIMSNRGGAENFQIFHTKKSAPQEGNWKLLIPTRKEFLIEGILALNSHIVLEGRENALNQIEVYSKKGRKVSRLSFQDPVYVARLTQNQDPAAEKIRYAYSSLKTPPSFFDFDLRERSTTLVQQNEVPNYNSDLYHSERVWATARDQKRIPVSLVYRKDLFKKGGAPLLQYAYGSYGISTDPRFNPNVFSLLDRGFVFAIAHVRGGQELGRQWYEDGRLKKKMNSFLDFIDVTEHLIKIGYAHPQKVYLQGGSAGGLLVGAVINLRPDLYKGAHAAVPFVDVLTTMLDDSLPLTVAEYEQWGNPNLKEDYFVMKSYSPYDNIQNKSYPHLLVTTGYHDSQVQYWEPLKWVAKLRDFNQGQTLTLMRTQMQAGHSGVTGRFARTREKADEYAFFLWLEQ